MIDEPTGFEPDYRYTNLIAVGQERSPPEYGAWMSFMWTIGLVLRALTLCSYC
jgi:hypothetical protein